MHKRRCSNTRRSPALNFGSSWSASSGAHPAYEVAPEKKEKLLSQMHVVVERWRSFMPKSRFYSQDFQRPASVVGRTAASNGISSASVEWHPSAPAWRSNEGRPH